MIDKGDAIMTPETQEDEQDAKDAEEARQEPGERIRLEEYVAKRVPGSCEHPLSLIGFDGKGVSIQCELLNVHTVHMARGSGAQGESLKNINWKLIWEEE